MAEKPLDHDTVTVEKQKKRRRPKPDLPDDLSPEQMQNPYPPQYGAQPPPPLDQNIVILQNVQEAPVLPLQMAPREPEEKPSDPDYEYDMYKLAPHVEISFEETFTEPEGASGLKCTTFVNKVIYKCAHLTVYAVIAMIIGPIMTFTCGITFALNHIIIIWFVQPCIKLCFMWIRIG